MEWKNRKVFVSGGAGVIGRELVAMLNAEGANVLVGDLKKRPVEFHGRIKYRRGDLLYVKREDIEQFQPEYFFHLAATFERSTETYEFYEANYHHNIALSHHLADIARSLLSLRCIVFASSYLIYDPQFYCSNDNRKVVPSLKETDAIRPRNLTGMAKSLHEMELEFISRFREPPIRSINARIFRGYGRGSRDVISRWIRSLMLDEEIAIYCQEGAFDYIHARDSASGLKKLAESDFSGTVNLGTGIARQVADVVDVLTLHFPEARTRCIASDIPVENSFADTTLLRAVTGWIPQLTLEDGIADVVEFERNHSEAAEIERKILITSLSRKAPLANAVRTAVQKLGTDYSVIGGDTDALSVARPLVDEFWRMPRLDSMSVSELLDALKQRNIRYVIPTRDGELDFWSDIAQRLATEGIQVMVSCSGTVSDCLDKLRFYHRACEIGVSAVPTYEDIGLVESERYVVKERFGAGANEIALDINHESAVRHATQLKSPIFQPYIEGDEFSVDAYVTRRGQVKGVICRTRTKVVNGESQITTANENAALETASVKLLNGLKAYGHVVIQAIVNDYGQITFIECNSRFGGASTCAVQCGLDSFYWFLLEADGEDVSDYPFVAASLPKTMIRVPADVFVDGHCF